MDPESKKLLEETLELVQENNKMLHRVRSVQKWATFWSGLKIIVIIGLALGSFYFLEPYINKGVDLYNSISNTTQKVKGAADNVKNITDIPNTLLEDFLKKF
jgi:hypothetical protein